jgi:hypothetical protein
MENIDALIERADARLRDAGRTITPCSSPAPPKLR